MISKDLQRTVQSLLEHSVEQAQSVSGGSINEAAKIQAGGKPYFLKWNFDAPTDMFAKEEMGLTLLRLANSGLRIPSVIGSGKTDTGTDYILIEYLSEGTAGANSHRTFGTQLAALHQVTAEKYGLDHDNFIGRLPQSNTKHQKWTDFFITERLQPQLRIAVNDNKLRQIQENMERLYQKLPDLLTDEPASLLHGDLWSGNYFFDENGQPAIYDPAVYYGNREIELAFTHLFGGFRPDFYSAYKEAFPIQPGFNERKDIYNLYPLLVHANMFGGSYMRRVERIAMQY